MFSRSCSRNACSAGAVATLTYDYSDSTAVLGPLATTAEPHSYDLCERHAKSLTVPRGWQVVRLETNFEPAPPSADDLYALADAVREAAANPRPAGHHADRQPRQAPAPVTHEIVDPAIARRAAFQVLEGGANE